MHLINFSIRFQITTKFIKMMRITIDGIPKNEIWSSKPFEMMTCSNANTSMAKLLAY